MKTNFGRQLRQQPGSSRARHQLSLHIRALTCVRAENPEFTQGGRRSWQRRQAQDTRAITCALAPPTKLRLRSRRSTTSMGTPIPVWTHRPRAQSACAGSLPRAHLISSSWCDGGVSDETCSGEQWDQKSSIGSKSPCAHGGSGKYGTAGDVK